MGLKEQKECIDPKYQRDKGVDTYYPQGTLCFKDPSAGIIVFNAFWLLNLDVIYLYHLSQSLVKYSTFLIFSMSMVLFWIVQFIHQTKAASPTHNKSLLYIVSILFQNLVRILDLQGLVLSGPGQREMTRKVSQLINQLIHPAWQPTPKWLNTNIALLGLSQCKR